MKKHCCNHHNCDCRKPCEKKPVDNQQRYGLDNVCRQWPLKRVPVGKESYEKLLQNNVALEEQVKQQQAQIKSLMIKLKGVRKARKREIERGADLFVRILAMDTFIDRVEDKLEKKGKVTLSDWANIFNSLFDLFEH